MVFAISDSIVILFELWGVIAPEQLANITSALLGFTTGRFGWFYLLSTLGFLIFVLYLAVCIYGNIRLGDDDEEPEYSIMSWFAMLFRAGMGIGLVFWG